VVLADLDLLQEGFTEDVDRNRFELLVKTDEVFEHQLSNIDFPVKFYKQKCESFVDCWRVCMALRGEAL